MHFYGDGFEYFSDVAVAADEIGEFCRRWGRITCYTTKEKYGTARVYVTFGACSLHALLYPDRPFKHRRWPQWLWSFDVCHGHQITWPLSRVLPWWQRAVYRAAYRRALRRYSHITAEIIGGADYPELLR